MELVKKFFNSHRATFIVIWTTFGGTMINAVIQYLGSGHFDWKKLLAAILTVVAGYGKSPLAPKK